MCQFRITGGSRHRGVWTHSQALLHGAQDQKAEESPSWWHGVQASRPLCPEAPPMGSRTLKLVRSSSKASGIPCCCGSRSKAVFLCRKNSTLFLPHSAFRQRCTVSGERTEAKAPPPRGETVKLFAPKCCTKGTQIVPSPGGEAGTRLDKGTCRCGPAHPPRRAQSRMGTVEAGLGGSSKKIPSIRLKTVRDHQNYGTRGDGKQANGLEQQ